MYPIYRPNDVGKVSPQGTVRRGKPSGDKFKEILQKEISSGVEFSKHALKRTQQRGIVFDGQELSKISSAVDKLQKKGTKEALLLYRDVALLVNVKDRRVITCVNKERLKEDVFTNIDGVMIVE